MAHCKWREEQSRGYYDKKPSRSSVIVKYRSEIGAEGRSDERGTDGRACGGVTSCLKPKLDKLPLCSSPCVLGGAPQKATACK